MELKITKTVEIKNPKEWETYAPPMKSNQLKDGRSARSLAQFAFNEQKVQILEQLFKELKYDTKGIIECTPEANTQLPGKGNGRNHDLLMIGKDFVAGIEAKVTESFGNTIKKESTNASDNKLLRIDSLVKDLFNCEVNENIEDLRYQLLTGAVGTILEAIRNKKNKALFLVIVFTDAISVSDKNTVNNNDDDFKEFCKYLKLGDNGGTKEIMGIDFSVRKIEVSLSK